MSIHQNSRLDEVPDDAFGSWRAIAAAFLLAIALVAIVIFCSAVSL